MKIKWYGHSVFRIETADGLAILTDPCAPTTGYKLKDIPCDVITSSHAHYDHNYFVAAAGTPQILSVAGTTEIGGIRFTAIPCFHDEEQGAKRGSNLIFVIEADGLRIVHMGDIGHQLSEEQLEAIGKPDVLLCPVGGVFTVDPLGACKIASALCPRVFIPMHYQTEVLGFNVTLATVEDFLKITRTPDIQRLNGSEWIVTPETLPASGRVVVFDYDR